LAASKSKLEALGKLRERGNDELTQQDSSNKFLLSTNDKKRTA